MPEAWIEHINQRGMVMLGCGHMGGAMLSAWLAAGVRPASVHILNQSGQSRFAEIGVSINGRLPERPACVVLAVKPQIMGDVIGKVTAWRDQSVPYISVAAGLRLAAFERWLAPTTPILRAMPNMPVSIGQGITALVGNAACQQADRDLAEQMMRSLGEAVWLRTEDEMDAVTAVSGSGPGYLYHMIEALAAAAEAEGLAPDAAMTLARATISGAAALAADSADVAAMRQSIAISGGTTEAGLKVLMAEGTGLTALMHRTVAAAAARSRAIADDLQ